MARAIDVDKAMEVAQIKYNDWNLAMAAADGQREINLCFKKQELFKAVKAVLECVPTLTPPNEPLPVLVNDEPGREYIDYICPRCRDIISQRRRGQRAETVYQCKYHDNCGQHVDWSNPRPYRRPPEGEEDT